MKKVIYLYALEDTRAVILSAMRLLRGFMVETVGELMDDLPELNQIHQMLSHKRDELNEIIKLADERDGLKIEDNVQKLKEMIQRLKEGKA